MVRWAWRALSNAKTVGIRCSSALQEGGGGGGGGKMMTLSPLLQCLVLSVYIIIKQVN